MTYRPLTAGLPFFRVFMGGAGGVGAESAPSGQPSLRRMYLTMSSLIDIRGLEWRQASKNASRMSSLSNTLIRAGLGFSFFIAVKMLGG